MTHHHHANDRTHAAQDREAREEGGQDLLELLIEHGFEGMVQALEVC